MPNLIEKALEDSNRSLLIKSYLDSGESLPDELLGQLIYEKIHQHDCLENGWVLDGYPSTSSQAEILCSHGIECDLFIVIDPPVSTSLERTSSRVLGQNMIRNKMRIRSESDDEFETQDFKTNLPKMLDRFPHSIRVSIHGDSDLVWSELYPQVKRALMRSVIFMVGGPCSGKHTHCKHIQSEYQNIHYVSLDQLIENEKKNRTDIYKNIKYNTDRGTLIPSDIVCNLLLRNILSFKSQSNQYFLIDSFPRNLQDLSTWLLMTETLCVIEMVFYLKCSEEIILNRLNEQNEGSIGTTDSNEVKMDDNAGSIAKRFRHFREFTLPVISFFKRCGKVCDVNAAVPMRTVYTRLSGVLNMLPIIPQYERTVMVLHPNIVAEGKVSKIFEAIKSLHVTSILTRFVIFNEKVIEILYKQYLLNSVYAEIISFLTSGPSLVVVIEGTDAIRRIRNLLGPEDPGQAIKVCPSSLRAKYGVNKIQNVAYCSVNDVASLLDIDLWFNPSKPGFQCAIEGPSQDLERYEEIFDEMNESNSIIHNEDDSIPTEDTLVLIKPNSSEIHSDSLKSILFLHGYDILSEVKLRMNEKLIDDIYSWKIGAIPYNSFKELLLSGAVIALHIRRVAAIKGMKYLIGPDDPNEWKTIRKDCIRALYGLSRVNNCLESSDSIQISMKELNFYFPQTCRLVHQQLITAPIDETKHQISSKDMPKLVEKIRLTAKRRKKNQGPQPMSLLRHREMLNYLADEVNPVMKDLLQRILIHRPKDILGYAIKDLIEQQRLSMENTSRMKLNPPLKPITQPSNLPPIAPSPLTTALPSISSLSPEKPEVDQDSNTQNEEDATLLLDLLGLGLGMTSNQEDGPTYNGKPLTLEIAKTEISRLRNTIQVISQNILTDSSSTQSDELFNKPSSDGQSEVVNKMKQLEFLHFSDLVGMGKEYDDLLIGDSLARFVASLKEQLSSKPIILFSGNFLGCTKSFTSSHFSSMFELLNTAGIQLYLVDLQSNRCKLWCSWKS